MIQIEMSKDINDFSPKIISVFDKRQLVCVGIAASYGLPIMFFATGFDIYTRMMIAAVLMFPVLACGWVKAYGMSFERFCYHIIKTQVFGKTTRYYKTENAFDYIDPTKPAPQKPGAEKPTKKKGKAKKKYKADLIKYGGQF